MTYNHEIAQKVLALQQQAKTENVCIALDWLSLYYTQAAFPEEIEEGDVYPLSDECYLLGVDLPTEHFKSRLAVIYKGQEIATLLLNSRSEKFFKKDVVKVDYKNLSLYSGEWYTIHRLILENGLLYKGPGRIDIAIDGMNSLQKILNVYCKQDVENKTIFLKNNSVKRALFSPRVLNPQTMLCENFTVGTTGGKKMITVYNKSLEIVRSGKKYIQEYWLRNGVIRELQDIDAQQTEIERREKLGYETFHLNGFENIYRFEIRLKSEAVREIENFTVEMLRDAKSLAGIVKLHTKKYFELFWKDAKKVSDCTPLDIIPFDKLEAQYLEKIERTESDGTYNAKTTIHGLVRDIYRCRINPKHLNDALQTIRDRIERYKLGEYVEKKLDEWQRRYYLTTPAPEIDAVTIFFAHLGAEVRRYLKETDDLATRHDQAGPTAAFGEDIPEFDA